MRVDGVRGAGGGSGRRGAHLEQSSRYTVRWERAATGVKIEGAWFLRIPPRRASIRPVIMASQRNRVFPPAAASRAGAGAGAGAAAAWSTTQNIFEISIICSKVWMLARSSWGPHECLRLTCMGCAHEGNVTLVQDPHRLRWRSHVRAK